MSNKNTIAVFCNARNELNIIDWAIHHSNIGFDYIIIFDHLSTYPIKNIFGNNNFIFNKSNIIILRSNIEKNNIKQDFMNQALNIAKKKQITWFIYLDADEYIYLHDQFNNNIKNIVNLFIRKSNADLIGINWLMFGTNYLIEEPMNNKFIIENYTRCSFMIDKHIKCLIKTEYAINSTNPHFYHMKYKERMIGLDFNQIVSPYCFHSINIPYHCLPCYIAHYVNQSEETYKRRKLTRMMDDGTWKDKIGNKIHLQYNDEENTQMLKYVPLITEQLEKYFYNNNNNNNMINNDDFNMIPNEIYKK